MLRGNLILADSSVSNIGERKRLTFLKKLTPESRSPPYAEPPKLRTRKQRVLAGDSSDHQVSLER